MVNERPSLNARRTQHALRGFTMVELVAVIIIAGILAALAAPRFFDRNVFESRGFYDQVISTLRYAQKAAIAQNRFVCVAFTASNITLTHGATAACGSNLASPTGSSYSVDAPAGVSLSGYSNFYFSALGRPSFAAQQSISVTGYTTPILIEAETGYVH